MALLIIHHKVGDYETFKKVFLDDEDRRRRAGCGGARVHQNAFDPSDVWVVLEVATAEQARAHAEGLELHEAVKLATGNVSMPDFVGLQNAMETDAQDPVRLRGVGGGRP